MSIPPVFSHWKSGYCIMNITSLDQSFRTIVDEMCEKKCYTYWPIQIVDTICHYCLMMYVEKDDNMNKILSAIDAKNKYAMNFLAAYYRFLNHYDNSNISKQNSIKYSLMSLSYDNCDSIVYLECFSVSYKKIYLAMSKHLRQQYQKSNKYKNILIYENELCSICYCYKDCVDKNDLYYCGDCY